MTELAERALVGALLWDPRRLRDVQWLRADNFHRPAYGAIYATLRGMVRDGKPIDLVALPDVIAASHGVYHSVMVDQYGPLSAPALADLLRSTPADRWMVGDGDLYDMDSATPSSDKAEHRRYAQLVLEASIRRQVVAMGVRIDQAAEQEQGFVPAAQPSLDPDRYVTRIDTPRLAETLTRQLDRASTRLGELTDQLTRAENGRSTAADGAGGGMPVDIPALIAGRGRRDPSSTWSEEVLIGACMNIPWLRELAATRLVPDDLTHPATAATWTSLRAMTESGQTVDYVLLAARQLRDHATTRGPDQAAAPLRASELARLAQRSNVAAGCHALKHVTHGALLRAADRSQRLLTALAADPALDSERLVGTAGEVLRQLRGTVARLAAPAGTDPAAATAVAAPAPRARAYSGPAGAVASVMGGAALPMSAAPPPQRAPMPVVRPGIPGPAAIPATPRRSR